MSTAESTTTQTARRCCPEHPTISILADHLVRDYPQRAAEQVLSVLVEVHRSCTTVDLPFFDVLDTVEQMARQLLEQGLSGTESRDAPAG